MPPVKIENLAPMPFFARFLEGQYSELTPEQMKNLRGGASMVTQAAPSDSDAAEVRPSPFPWPDTNQFPWNAVGQMPTWPFDPARGPGPYPID